MPDPSRPSHPTQLSLRAVSTSSSHRVVLDSLDVSFPPGRVSGLIGENGSGKSTVLRLLAGTRTPDEGTVTVHAVGGVGLLDQDAGWRPDRTVAQVVDAALAELRAAETRMADLAAELAESAESAQSDQSDQSAELTEGPVDLEALLAAYGEAVEDVERHGGYDADARVAEAFAALGLAGLDRDRPVGELSGGQRRRVQLATLLATHPEVLLLDEPTNDLDDAAAAWLEGRLRARTGTTVVVSHDRVFLDRVAGVLFELDPTAPNERQARVTRYPGTYADHRRSRDLARARWVADRARWEDDVATAREAAATTARRVAPHRAMTDRNTMAYDRARGRVQASLASRVRRADEHLRRLLDDPVPAPPDPPRLRATVRETDGGGSTELRAGAVAVDGRLAPTTLRVGPGDRILITGANGTGKSTLLDVLAGRIVPSAGAVHRPGAVGYLPQQPAADPADTVLAAFARDRGPGDHAAALAGLGLFTEEETRRRVGTLSTGGRRRVDLARLLADPHDVVLLDEPTNHLALSLVEDLEAALAGFSGGLVVVSHDRRLRAAWSGTVVALDALGRAA